MRLLVPPIHKLLLELQEVSCIVLTQIFYLVHLLAHLLSDESLLIVSLMEDQIAHFITESFLSHSRYIREVGKASINNILVMQFE